jgi:SAM-dependent methyltransferase
MSRGKNPLRIFFGIRIAGELASNPSRACMGSVRGGANKSSAPGRETKKMSLGTLTSNLHRYGWRITALHAYLAIHRRTVGPIADRLGDFLFDRIHGTQTNDMIVPEDDEIYGGTERPACGYMPTRPGPFHKVMRALRIPPGGGFVDYGSGKGRILLLATRYGFDRITGLELSPKLCETARRNIEIYGARHADMPPIEVISGDALRHETDDRDKVFFFYNPFPLPVVESVLRNILKSYKRKPRAMWFIFHNTGCMKLLEDHPFLTDLGEFNFWGAGRYFRVYKAEG